MTNQSNNPVSSLAATVRKYRERAGLSVRTLATQAGIHHSYLARLENGDNDRPTPEVLQSIATALDVEPGKLLRFIGIKPTTVIPTPRAYFRRAYGMTPAQASEAAERMEHIVRELRDHHEQQNNKQSRGGTRP
jgi:transcriptional regulator with XRE-family HTH domain